MTGAAAETRDIDSEIDCLLSRQPERLPFLHPSWLRAWFDEFGGDREPVFIRTGGEEVTGIAALMREDARLTFMGDSSVCDFMDFLIDPDRVDAAYQGLWDEICQREWSELELWGLMETSPTRDAVKTLAAKAGYSFREEAEAVAPRLSLPGTWDEYLAFLGKKDRHELRRKMRRLLEGGAAIDLRVVTEQSEVSAAIEEFLALHTASRQDKADFMSDGMGQFFRRMASAMAGAGLLRLFMLHVNSRPAAAVLCFDAGNCLYLYNSGYDPSLAGLSVGLVSKAQCVVWAIESGKQCLDFLRGNEPYKYDLGAVDRQIFTISVRR